MIAIALPILTYICLDFTWWGNVSRKEVMLESKLQTNPQLKEVRIMHGLDTMQRLNKEAEVRENKKMQEMMRRLGYGKEVNAR